MANVTKFLAGHYRVAIDGAVAYGHIRRSGRVWLATIHNDKTGDMIRPAGEWNSKKAAIEECEFLIPRTSVVTRMA